MLPITERLTRRSIRHLVSCAAIAAAVASPLASAAVYSAAGDFSSVANPNGAWQYGWSNSVGGLFNLHTSSVDSGGLSVWHSGINLLGGYDPVVAHNGTGAPVGNAELTWAPGQLTLHPGVYTAPFDIYTQRPYAVLRWTAPHAGGFSLTAEFFGLDALGRTGTDIHLLRNGVALFEDDVVGYGEPSKIGYANVLSMLAGDTLDVVVGPGARLPPLGDYQWDTTAASLTITNVAVPEPASLGLLALGLAGLAWRRSRPPAHRQGG